MRRIMLALRGGKRYDYFGIVEKDCDYVWTAIPVYTANKSISSQESNSSS